MIQFLINPAELILGVSYTPLKALTISRMWVYFYTYTEKSILFSSNFILLTSIGAILFKFLILISVLHSLNKQSPAGHFSSMK